MSTPFDGDFNVSRAKMLEALGISRIEEQPVCGAVIAFSGDHGGYTIEAGEGKHYGLGFLEYCRQKYGDTKLDFTITLPMVCEAIMYYGLPLWNDTSKEHPSIIPFRRALAGEEVRVKIHHKSDR